MLIKYKNCSDGKNDPIRIYDTKRAYKTNDFIRSRVSYHKFLTSQIKLIRENFEDKIITFYEIPYNVIKDFKPSALKAGG